MTTPEEVIEGTTKAAVKNQRRTAVTQTKTVTDAVEQFEEAPTTVLLKMDRKNVSFEIRGLRFTKEHPFAVTDEKTALLVMAEAEGIRFASPLEAREFYS